jgi:ribosomal protein L40E
VTCGKCGAKLPEGSQYCLKCGHAVSALTTAPPSPSTGVVECSVCGANLPSASQFCPRCGQAVIGAFSRWAPPLPRPQKRRSALWFLVPALLMVLAWAALSDNPGAQELQRLANLSHAETITPAVFSVGSHAFASYRFSVPEGVRNVTVSGEFGATGSAAHDDEVEVYLLTAGDLVNWQYGYSPAAFYSSGRVTHGDVDAVLPPAAGAYCIVFNNNFSPRTAKSVHANVTLRYKRWWPLS